MGPCQAPIPDALLVDYWARDPLESDDLDRLEQHLFACGRCSERLQEIAALQAGVSALVRQGRVAGMISRSVLNRLQREGVHVRMFSLVPGDIVPCAVFPGDDMVVTALRADFTGVDVVSISVAGPGDSLFAHFDDVPVPQPPNELLWANSAASLQQLPSMRLEITLTSSGGVPTVLGRYVLEHAAQPR